VTATSQCFWRNSCGQYKTDSAVGQLAAEQRKLLLSMVKPLMPPVNQLCDKVLAIPGVAEVLKPSVDTLKAKLTALTA
jgi:hypothetical protein